MFGSSSHVCKHARPVHRCPPFLPLADFYDVLSAAWCVAVAQVQAGAELCPTDRNPYSLVTQRYALGVADALRLALKRQWTFFLRNKAFIIFRLLQVATTRLWRPRGGGVFCAAAALLRPHSCSQEF